MRNSKPKNIKVSLVVEVVKDDIRNKEIIQSIIDQTLSEFQVVCIKKDEGTSNFIKDTFSEDERFLFLDDDSQIVDHIEGKYVLFVDEYTLLEPTALERLYGKAKATKADITCCNSVGTKASLKNDTSLSQYTGSAELFEKIPLLTGCFFYEKCFLLQYFSEFVKSVKDFDISTAIQLLVCTSRIVCFDIELVHCSCDWVYMGLWDKIFAGFEKTYHFLKAKNKLRQYKKNFLTRFFDVILGKEKELKEPLRSVFDLEVLSKLEKEYSDIGDVLSKHPLYLSLHKPNVSPEFLNRWKENPDSIVPIVIPARGEEDMYHAAVTIQSIIDNADVSEFYDIYILHPDIAKKELGQSLMRLSSDRFRISCLNVKDMISRAIGKWNSKYFECHLFLLADLLMYSKVLYIESHVICQKNILKLFHQDMEDAAVAGGLVYEDVAYIEKELGLVFESFLNKDCLLINLDVWRKKGYTQACMDLFLYPLKDYKFAPRDVLNYVCKDSIFVFDPFYCGKWKFICKQKMADIYQPYLPDDFIMINYSSESPFLRPELPLMDIWWSYAKRSLFYEAILFKMYTKKMLP